MYNQKFIDIKLQKQNNLLWLSLNRAQARNAITLDMVDSLEKILPYADNDPEVRVIILTGEGESFCAGGDIKNMLEEKEMFAGQSNELRMRYRNGIQKIPELIHRLNTPLVAMVNGHAIGAGCDLVAMADIAIASDKSKFGETFNKLALVPGDGGTYFLQRKIGFSKAMEMYLTCDIYNSQDALNMGLVNFVCRPEELKQKTIELAEKIASHAPIATSMTKRAMIHGYESNLTSQLDLLAAFQGISQRTLDHKEALRATLEKKQPDFKNL